MTLSLMALSWAFSPIIFSISARRRIFRPKLSVTSLSSRLPLALSSAVLSILPSIFLPFLLDSECVLLSLNTALTTASRTLLSRFDVMEGFAIGWLVSAFWTIFLVPIYLVKRAFSMPFDF